MLPIRDTLPRRGYPFIVWAIIIVNGMVFMFEASLPQDALKRLISLYGIVPARYLHPYEASGPAYYTSFLSTMFLHGGALHILSNMWFLHIFGDNVEDRMGHIKFLVFYLLCGISASITYIAFDFHSTIPSIGASGAIAGVLGAYFIMFPNARILTLVPTFIPYFVELPAFIFLGLWFVIQLYLGAFSLASPQAVGGIAWWAHIGGFVAGIVLLPFFRKDRRRYHP